MVDKLASRGALLQAKNNNGWCALHIAAQEGNLEAIQALIAHGCDIDIRDHEGLSLSPAPLCVYLTGDLRVESKRGNGGTAIGSAAVLSVHAAPL